MKDSRFRLTLKLACIGYFAVKRVFFLPLLIVSLLGTSLVNDIGPVRVIFKINPLKVSLFEPRCEKTGLRGFRPGHTQTGLYRHKSWLEA